MMRLLFVFLLLTTSTFAQSPSSDAKTLEALARKFGVAWLHGDIRTLDQLLAAEYTHTDVGGKVLHRTDWLADAANVQNWARVKGASGEPSIEFFDTQVTVQGNTAIITGGNTIRPVGADAKPLKLRYTQIWIREKGTWKRRFFQATAVRD